MNNIQFLPRTFCSGINPQHGVGEICTVFKFNLYISILVNNQIILKLTNCIPIKIQEFTCILTIY
jgi:hypothetical protein